jgi:hypothetical protein
VRRGFDVTVPVIVNDECYAAVIDSGSEACICREDVAKGWRLEKCPLALIDAQGASIAVHGQCDIDIEIGGVKLRQRFIVADISSCLLIGSNLL